MINPRQSEYLEYLNQHIGRVQQAWRDYLEPVVAREYPDSYYQAFQSIENHDASKLEEEEWDAYCNYFYPSDGCPKDETAFDLAWLHHQKNNPHHWQYWVLIRDGGELVPMDMSVSEICNMLCDWQSFSKRDPKSTAYAWYTQNKDKMILSDNTRKIVEKLIEYLKEPLV